MRLYNTLTDSKEEFVPIEENKVKMYVCGLTVYNYMHIGNARPYVVFDTVRRYFEYKNYEVNYIQNFTDVDDKIINLAIKENTTMSEITERYIKEAFVDAEGLNIKRATCNPKVTEEIDEIIEMIKVLIDKGYAYAKNGSVYYDTSKFADYGKLAKKNIDDLEAGIRIEVDSEKKNPSDFVLWKPHKEGEPKWTAPWGDGRPGWHIECSVMAKKYLGDTIDIHAGGEDLIFPHHQNEVAQSEAANGVKFSNYWLHNGFININNQKMSKSTGNFFTVRDIVEKFPYDVIRFYILSAHYRSPLNFSEELMESSQNGLNRIKNGISNIRYIIDNTTNDNISDTEKNLLENSREFKLDFESSMDDDFNTADAIASIFDFIRFANINIKENSSKEFANKMLESIIELCDILAIKTEIEVKLDGITEDEILNYIEERKTAKKNKDFARADEIRDILLDKNIVLEDTRQGVKWSIK